MTKSDPVHEFLKEPTEVEQQLFGRAMAVGARHSRLFSALALAWLWFSISVYARWITLPEIPFLTDQQIATLGIIYNVGWWAFVRPRIVKMKERHDAMMEHSNG